MKSDIAVVAAGDRAGTARDSHALAPLVRNLGLVAYDPTYAAMRRFTESRNEHTRDEIWVLQHTPVFTTGVAGRSEHFPGNTAIPVVRTDRGGQITYHGPGQTIAYLLLDIARRELKVRALVQLIESSVIQLLATYNVFAETRRGAPGVYVGGAKIAALGLRVRAGYCYHGVSLNVDMDPSPFCAIDPCGFPGLPVTQMKDHGIDTGVDVVGGRLAALLCERLDAHERTR